MTSNAPSRVEWAKLYEAAVRTKAPALWKWMSSSDLFAVGNFETDEIGYVSVMGALGEHLSVALYLGAEGLYGFFHFDEEDDVPADDILLVPHLQAGFMDRDVLTDQDRAVIMELGLKFRGRQAWPWFRSFRPGYFPWYLEAHEARFLTHVLEQLLVVADHLRRDEGLLAEDNGPLMRVARQEGDALVWEDDRLPALPPPPEPMLLHLKLDERLLATLRAKPARAAALEMDLTLLPSGIGERGTRARTAYRLLIVEAARGFVLGSELLIADPNLTALYEQIPQAIVRLLARTGTLPRVVRARSQILLQLLDEMADDLGFVFEGVLRPAQSGPGPGVRGAVPRPVVRTAPQRGQVTPEVADRGVVHTRPPTQPREGSPLTQGGRSRRRRPTSRCHC